MEHLLSLLGHLDPASCLINFKLAWKTAGLLALVAVKHFFYLACYALIINSFFFSIILLFLFLHMVVKWIEQFIFHLKFVWNNISLLIFVLYLFEGLFMEFCANNKEVIWISDVLSGYW